MKIVKSRSDFSRSFSVQNLMSISGTFLNFSVRSIERNITLLTFRVSPFLISATQKVVSFFQDSLNVAERLAFAEVTSSGESLDADMSKTYEILELKKEDMTSLESYIKEYYQQILKRLREMEADLNIEEKKRLPF